MRESLLTAHESGLLNFQEFCNPADITLVKWNQPWWEYLHHGNWQMPQSRASSPFPLRTCYTFTSCWLRTLEMEGNDFHLTCQVLLIGSGCLEVFASWDGAWDFMKNLPELWSAVAGKEGELAAAVPCTGPLSLTPSDALVLKMEKQRPRERRWFAWSHVVNQGQSWD